MVAGRAPGDVSAHLLARRAPAHLPVYGLEGGSPATDPGTARCPGEGTCASALSRGSGSEGRGTGHGRRKKKRTRTPAIAQPTPSSRPPAVASPPAPPLRRNQIVRIGLTTARDKVVVSAGSGTFRILDPATALPVWRESYSGAVTIGIRGASPTSGRVYRAQVGSFEEKEPAEQLAARLRSELSVPVIVAWSPDRNVWRIRAGEADSRGGLADVMGKLRAAGYADAWIADEAVIQKDASALVLLDASYETYAVPGRVMTIAPPSESAFLTVDGATYRGSLEVRLDAAGGIRVIDILPIESYLRGVVPAELGPDVYPEIEAIKAQALAARTYTYRNLGQFAEEGFDLCDTPRCQVYSGVKAEHPLSDRAIAETEGEIAIYQDRPINAMYTSTCGGHTEDAAVIFPENTAPYLVGVPCAPEERSRKQRRILLSGDPALVSAPNARAAEAAALLTVNGILDRGAVTAAPLSSPVASAEATTWIDALGAACGVVRPAAATGQAAAADTASSVAALAARLIARMGWKDRIDLLIAHEDPQSWLRDEVEDLSGDEASAAAYFLKVGGWPQGPDGRIAPDRIATRGDLAQLLLAAAKDCDRISLREGIVRGGDTGSLQLTLKGTNEEHAVPDRALIFADFGSGAVPMRRVGVVAGDKVRYHLAASGQIDQMTLLPGREGASDDRYSNLSSWTVAYTADDLAKRLNDYLGSGGQILDIAPVRRGVSGRVTELRVAGTRGEAVIKGFTIRTALGLRENLFTIDKQAGPDGALRRVVFTGRGWGHGIGMCQVGAYGMALRGRSYKEILTHYYSGIRVEKLP